MKKILIITAFAFYGITAMAQVKIGNNPTTVNPNAVLELESSDQGLMHPRVALTGTANAAPLSAHVRGMVVYNTATTGDVKPGLYVNDGAKWAPIDNSARATAGTDVTVVCNGFQGTYFPGTATRSFSVSYSNNTFASVTIPLAVSDLVLSPASGLTVASVASSATIASGTTSVVFYSLGGSITASTGTVITGTITKLGLNCSKTVAVGNIAPVVSAGSAQSVGISVATTTLTGTATDADGIATYAWTKTGGTGTATPVITSPSSASTTVTGLNAVGTYIFTLTATDTFGGTANATVTITVTPAPLPSGNITLGTSGSHFIASIYDQDYLPYTAPTAAASLTTPVAANGVNEATAIDIQGTLTTTGVTISIPYTVVTASVNLPAFSQTVTIPASYTQDGISRDVTFSYNAATLAVGSGKVTATLKAVGGTLNVKKLDMQTGIGNDNLGWLLAQFTYSTNNSGGTSNFQVRAIAPIPDRNIANANHVMFYVPITAEDGNVWLNNNLGADYANTAKAVFNPAQQATAHNDHNAYGSMFQWGRYSDGHELMNRTSPTSSTNVNGTTTTKATTNTPGHGLYITTTASGGNGSTFDWRTPQNNNLWQGVSGINNPCPVGYRVPTAAEFTNLITLSGMTNDVTAGSSTLKISAVANGTLGIYWSSTPTAGSTTDNNYSEAFSTTSNYVRTSFGYRMSAMAVRCIKN